MPYDTLLAMVNAPDVEAAMVPSDTSVVVRLQSTVTQPPTVILALLVVADVCSRLIQPLDSARTLLSAMKTKPSLES